jgi:Xaa-Pro aminopeptidase
VEHMKKSTGAVLLVGNAAACPDIEYASGFRPDDPVVFLQYKRHRTLLVGEIDAGRAERPGKQVEIVTPNSLGLAKRERKSLSTMALALLRRAGIKKVVVPPFFPYAVAKRLEKAGIKLSIDQEVFPQRAVKTTEEIGMVRQSQQAAVIAMRAAVATISASSIERDGTLVLRGGALTSDNVRVVIRRTLFDHNCVARDIIVSNGRQSADPHEPGHGELLAHEPIIIDIFPQHTAHGYWGDITRTVVRGQPSRQLAKMYHAVKAAQAAALHEVRPGVSSSTVHKAAAAEIRRRGFLTRTKDGQAEGFIHTTGHGVGLEIHEAPSVGPIGSRLRCGNVITIEPGLYYPELGGVRLEDTIVVTSNGWRYLAPCEKRLEV